MLAQPGDIYGRPTSEQSQLEAGNLDALIRQCIANDRTAQKRMYDTYAPLMYGIINRYVNDNNAAKEILNDVFYRVFTRLPQYSFEGAFEGWMRRIAVNIISDHFRRNAKHDVITGKEVELINAHVDNETVGNINYKQLLQLIQELPDTQRAVFNLHVFENYSHKEISDLLGISDNNSRWHLNDARKRLKEKINKML